MGCRGRSGFPCFHPCSSRLAARCPRLLVTPLSFDRVRFLCRPVAARSHPPQQLPHQRGLTPNSRPHLCDVPSPHVAPSTDRDPCLTSTAPLVVPPCLMKAELSTWLQEELLMWLRQGGTLLYQGSFLMTSLAPSCAVSPNRLYA
jgi:hypothetical protein